MRMPAPDAATIAKKRRIVRALQRLVPGEGVVPPFRWFANTAGVAAF